MQEELQYNVNVGDIIDKMYLVYDIDIWEDWYFPIGIRAINLDNGKEYQNYLQGWVESFRFGYGFDISII